MYFLIAFGYRWIAWHTLPLIPFSIINNRLILAKRYNFTLVVFGAAYHANPGAVRKQPYYSEHIYWKISNLSAKNNELFWIYKSWCSSKLFIFAILVQIICVTNTFHV